MKFEKLSEKECLELCSKTTSKNVLYGGINFSMPRRSTKSSAGYDFHSPFKVTIKKGKTVKFPLLVKCIDMPENAVLLMMNRSGLSLKNGITIDNAVGVIDADYENCIWIQLTNNGNKTYVIDINDKVAQGIFISYLVTDDDNPSKKSRNGKGFGSTGK